MEQFDSSEKESFRVLEQQQRNDEQQCPSCAAELIETEVRLDPGQSSSLNAKNQTANGWKGRRGPKEPLSIDLYIHRLRADSRLSSSSSIPFKYELFFIKIMSIFFHIC